MPSSGRKPHRLVPRLINLFRTVLPGWRLHSQACANQKIMVFGFGKFPHRECRASAQVDGKLGPEVSQSGARDALLLQLRTNFSFYVSKRIRKSCCHQRLPTEQAKGAPYAEQWTVNSGMHVRHLNGRVKDDFSTGASEPGDQENSRPWDDGEYARGSSSCAAMGTRHSKSAKQTKITAVLSRIDTNPELRCACCNLTTDWKCSSSSRCL